MIPALDHATLDSLRQHHPAWRLLCSPHAPLVASFLHRVFVVANVRTMTAATLAEKLEDDLYALRQRPDQATAYPKTAPDYLNDWAAPDKGWLRKFYRPGSDEAQFDLTPATENAIAWLGKLTERSFVGTESRLMTLFELLRQMSEGSDTDPARRIAELHRRRDDIDSELARVAAGDLPLLDDAAVRDRFQQFTQVARELLSDFREVEQNFRLLDRRVRERIALWDGAKGALLHDIMGERDAITDSDQGRSFRGFWDFLMSGRRQEELSERLARVLTLPSVSELRPDPRLKRIHHDWLEAGEHTQRTVAQLSQQLRRFLDDQAWLENRRIMDILHGIESKAVALRDTPPVGEVTDIASPVIDIELPMERPLYTPALKTIITDLVLETEAAGSEADTDALYQQVTLDRAPLTRHIHQTLQDRAQVTLRELIDARPLQQGLAELVTYLHLGSETFHTVIDETTTDDITWEIPDRELQGETLHRRARLPRVIFARDMKNP